MRTVLLTAFQPSCPWQKTCWGRAQNHHCSQWTVLAPRFCMSNHHSWHVCPASLIYPAGEFGTCVQNIQEKSLQLLPLNSPRTALVYTVLRAPTPCLQTGNTTVMERIHQEYRDFIGDLRDFGASHAPKAQLCQPTLPLFTALYHWDVWEQSLFHRKQPGNSEFNEAWILTLSVLNPTSVLGCFSPFIDNKVICL